MGNWALLVTLNKLLSLVLGDAAKILSEILLAADRHSFYAKYILGNSSRGRNVLSQA